MAQSFDLEYNNFKKGIVTEYTPLNFPKDASIDEENFIIDSSGERWRRRDLISSGSSNAFSGTPPYFMDMIYHEGSGFYVLLSLEGLGVPKIRTYGKSGSSSPYVLKDTYSSMDAMTGRSVMYAFEHGPYLVVAGGSDNNPSSPFNELGHIHFVFSISSTGAITLEGEYKPLVRDLEYVSSIDLDERPLTLSVHHEYDLLNANWPQTDIAAFQTSQGVYPALSDIRELGKSGTAFSATTMASYLGGSTAAPRGNYLINPVSVEQSRSEYQAADGVSSTGSWDTSRTTFAGSPRAGCSFAGRCWYAYSGGTASRSISSSFILFSQVGVEINTMKSCHSVHSPCSEQISDPLDTDGGYIDMAYAGTIYQMIVYGNSIIVFASNGVYEISSKDDVFKPTNFSVTKITGSKLVAPYTAAGDSIASSNSIVVFNDQIIFWAYDSIYMISRSNTQSGYKCESIISTTIQSLYDGISTSSKERAFGTFVSDRSELRWVYYDSSSVSYKELVLNAATGSWYKCTYKGEYDQGFRIQGIFYDEYHSGANYSITDYPVSPRLLYLAYDSSDPNDTLELLQHSSTPSFAYADAAFVETGYNMLDDQQRRKQVKYCTVSLTRTEDGFTEVNGDLVPDNQSGCKLIPKWDFANHSNSGKIGAEQQVYRYLRYYQPEDATDTYDYGQSVITTKNKVRGRGRSLVLRFESDGTKDCRLLGWGLQLQVGSVV